MPEETCIRFSPHSHSTCWNIRHSRHSVHSYSRFARRAWDQKRRELKPDLVGLTNQISEVPKVSEQLHLVKVNVDRSTNNLPEVAFDDPGQNLVSRAYANYRSSFLLNVCLTQHLARAVSFHFAARASPEV
jgi:hypothetical protein